MSGSAILGSSIGVEVNKTIKELPATHSSGADNCGESIEKVCSDANTSVAANFVIKWAVSTNILCDHHADSVGISSKDKSIYVGSHGAEISTVISGNSHGANAEYHTCTNPVGPTSTTDVAGGADAHLD